MNKQRWHITGMLVLMLVAFCSFSAVALAEEAAADAGVEKESMYSLLKKGGPIMIPLGLASVLALALGLERFISLRKDRVLPAGFIERLMSAWNADPTGKQAVAICDQNGGAVGHIFKAGIRRAKMGHEAVEKTIEDVGSREADKMKRSLRLLSIIATISPLLGLLGTVYGMIDAFQKTSMSGGTAKTAMLATGIYEALVTTAVGLTIAIPVLCLYQYLLGRVDKLVDEIDEAGAEFVFSYMENHSGLEIDTDDGEAESTKQGDATDKPVATAGA